MCVPNSLELIFQADGTAKSNGPLFDLEYLPVRTTIFDVR